LKYFYLARVVAEAEETRQVLAQAGEEARVTTSFVRRICILPRSQSRSEPEALAEAMTQTVLLVARQHLALIFRHMEVAEDRKESTPDVQAEEAAVRWALERHPRALPAPEEVRPIQRRLMEQAEEAEAGNKMEKKPSMVERAEAVMTPVSGPTMEDLLFLAEAGEVVDRLVQTARRMEAGEAEVRLVGRLKWPELLVRMAEAEAGEAGEIMAEQEPAVMQAQEEHTVEVAAAEEKEQAQAQAGMAGMADVS